MLKKWVSIILTSIILIGSTQVFAIEGQDIPVFQDMPQDWSTIALKNAIKNDLLKGSKGKILPNDNLTRAEMATIINRSFRSYERASIHGFKDVSSGAWYYDEMEKAVQMKTFNGNKDKLNPEKPITREEAFAVVSRAFKIDDKVTSLEGFLDIEDISPWAVEEVSGLITAGYIKGHKNKINPKGNITRAEFAQLMDNIIKSYISTPGIYESDINGNTMINVPGVILKGNTIEGDLIIGEGVGNGDVILDSVDINGKIIVRGGGENSIVVTGDSNLDKIILSRVDGAIRVKVEDEAYVDNVLVVDGKDKVILQGKIKNVEIKTKGVEVIQDDKK
ncbi:S-layer homology domain-containing protein [Tissierellaceae bacterium HCP3S3_D8]